MPDPTAPLTLAAATCFALETCQHKPHYSHGERVQRTKKLCESQQSQLDDAVKSLTDARSSVATLTQSLEVRTRPCVLCRNPVRGATGAAGTAGITRSARPRCPQEAKADNARLANEVSRATNGLQEATAAADEWRQRATALSEQCDALLVTSDNLKSQLQAKSAEVEAVKHAIASSASLLTASSRSRPADAPQPPYHRLHSQPPHQQQQALLPVRCNDQSIDTCCVVPVTARPHSLGSFIAIRTSGHSHCAVAVLFVDARRSGVHEAAVR